MSICDSESRDNRRMGATIHATALCESVIASSSFDMFKAFTYHVMYVHVFFHLCVCTQSHCLHLSVQPEGSVQHACVCSGVCMSATVWSCTCVVAWISNFHHVSRYCAHLCPYNVSFILQNRWVMEGEFHFIAGLPSDLE